MSKADPHRQPRPPAPSPPPSPDANPAAGAVPIVVAPTGLAPTAAANQFSFLGANPHPKNSPPKNPEPKNPEPRLPTAKPLAPTAQSSPSVLPALADEESPIDLSEQAVKSAPPFLISMVVHMALMISLALITFGQAVSNQVQIQATYAESLGKQLLDDKLQSPASLEMTAEIPALSFGLMPVDDPLAALPKLDSAFLDANRGSSDIEAPAIGLALTGREVGMKKALLPAYGGSATTESAVLEGLQWLKKQQMKDGGWSLTGPFDDGAINDNRCAATALALLAFHGYGATHKAGSSSPDFHDVVDRGWTFLLKMQDRDGFFQHDGTLNSRSYAQAQATIAICEIYGMTKDSKFKRPAQLALSWAHKAQSPELGGWRYNPREDSDMSVTGWYVMAFQSGLMAGLEVQSPNLELVNKFLDLVAREGGTQYAYQVGGDTRLSMTAEALLCRQYLGWKHNDPRMRAGINLLLANPIDYDEQNVYYWYYATQACHHMDGDDWNRWNAHLRERVPAAQTKTGNQRGSWSPLNDSWGSHGGRLYVTCLSIYLLETYYRHLPIYKWRLQ
jgi:hypothetical protein